MRTRRLVAVALVAASFIAASCGSDSNGSSGTTAASGGGSATTASAGGAGTTAAAAGEPIKVGFITKFPVDFYDTMVDAVKTWNKDHPEVRGHLRPGQERHRRRRRDRAHPVHGVAGGEGDRHHADQPERQG